MKILQLTYSLSSGGIERFVVDLSNELAENGHIVYLCVLYNDTLSDYGYFKEEISNKVIYINLKQSNRFNIFNIHHIGNVIKKIKPDIVHCHNNVINYIFPLSVLFKKIKFFHTIHSDAPAEIKYKVEYWLRRFFYSKSQIKAITISNETSKSFVNYYRTTSFYEIYNGRTLPKPSDEISSVTDYFQNIRKENKTVFVHVARCSPEKNQKMLVKVFNRLTEEGNPIVLIIIGRDFDSPLGDELKSIASEKIIFLSPRLNITDYYLNADAFCLSSIYEGMPITLIEALACGCTPICTAVGGISDAIENGITGFLSKTVTEEDYYQTIISYLNNKDRISMDSLRNTYKKRFSINECARQHIQLYDKNNQ